MGLNRSILAGRLVKDPEIRYTKDAMPVTHFRLAINWQGRTAKGTDYINCVAFNGLAKVCNEYLKKGRLVAVEGKLKISSFKNKNGQNQSSTEIMVDNLEMLDNKFVTSNTAQANQPQEEDSLVM